ncbi:hypothetical protein FNW50_00700 [Escherichia coli]|nr:hypothetical protein [Escherichia coli]EFB5484570.1 hypothetical protein [Escherichia coli]
MHRIDTKTAQKDKFGAGKNGFTRGNPQTGTPATDLDDDYFDMLQEELCSVVEASGASLEKARHDQLLTALRALLLSRKNPFGDIKSDGTVQTALENLGLGEAAKRDVGTTVGTVAAGDDLRITGALQKENNLYELTNKSDARANLGLGTVATKNVGNSAGQIPDMSYWSSPAGGINFPNGFQMRFGTIAGTGGKLFSTPFTNQCYGIVFGQTYGANYWMFSPMYRASDLSNTGFAFINKAWSGVPGVGSQDAGESVFYIAVGY